MTIVVSKWSDIFVDVDNIKVREDVFGNSLAIAAYHIDSTTPPGWNDPAKLNPEGKELSRPIYEVKEREAFKSDRPRLSLKMWERLKNSCKRR
jgi:hypothetical protein